jgi:hypothetical protein
MRIARKSFSLGKLYRKFSLGKISTQLNCYWLLFIQFGVVICQYKGDSPSYFQLKQEGRKQR